MTLFFYSLNFFMLVRIHSTDEKMFQFFLLSSSIFFPLRRYIFWGMLFFYFEQTARKKGSSMIPIIIFDGIVIDDAIFQWKEHSKEGKKTKIFYSKHELNWKNIRIERITKGKKYISTGKNTNRLIFFFILFFLYIRNKKCERMIIFVSSWIMDLNFEYFLFSFCFDVKRILTSNQLSSSIIKKIQN